jgi:hypothetical protein
MMARAIIYATLLLAFWAIKSFAAEFRFGPASPYVPNDRSQLYLIGEIVEGDLERFKQALRNTGGDFVTLQLRSTGGSVHEAIKIGRLVRALYMYTSSPFDRELTSGQWIAGVCEYDQQVLGVQVPCGCASACSLIFFAGVFRNGSELYIHRIAFDKKYFGGLSPEEAQQQYQVGIDEIRSYLTEMGVDEKYYYRMLRTSSGEAEKLSLEEAAQLNRWVPAFQEWLIAKCGSFQAFQQNVGNCWSSAYSAAQRDAFNREFGEASVGVQEKRSISVPIAPQIALETHWNFNGSLMKLESNGASRRFLYVAPHEGLRKAGVREGTVEFQGTQNGNLYDGTAYVFSRVCGAIGYHVSGFVTQDGQSITLRGSVPYYDSQCRPSGGRDGVLSYQLTDR